jgi:hypothetical protein
VSFKLPDFIVSINFVLGHSSTLNSRFIKAVLNLFKSFEFLPKKSALPLTRRSLVLGNHSNFLTGSSSGSYSSFFIFCSSLKIGEIQINSEVLRACIKNKLCIPENDKLRAGEEPKFRSLHTVTKVCRIVVHSSLELSEKHLERLMIMHFF